MAKATMAGRIPENFRRVIMAAAGGNIIEWYDFYIFGSLATILSVKFFEKSHPVAALLSTIALFTAGFLVRPLGAFVFGWLGDKVGRKYTFIMTLVGMALGTGAIGLIPTFEQIGLSAAIILFCLRMVQGLCLGGSSGINVAGAIRLANELGPGHTIVTVLCDYGTRYQSKLFNPEFLRSKGLPVPDWLEHKSTFKIPYEQT